MPGQHPGKDNKKESSFIQTLLSVPESHRIGPLRLADYAFAITAGKEFHLALKTDNNIAHTPVQFNTNI